MIDCTATLYKKNILQQISLSYLTRKSQNLVNQITSCGPAKLQHKIIDTQSVQNAMMKFFYALRQFATAKPPDLRT